MTTASKSDRDARLDDLEKAVKEWSERRAKQLDDQVELAKRVLRGRTGSQYVNNKTVERASDLLVTEIEEFLTGGG